MPGDPRAEMMINDLLMCICTELADAGRAACCCHWRRADQTLMPDACSCECVDGQGVAWVRIDERTFGDAAGIEVTRSRAFDGGFCGPAGMGEVWEMEAGVSRCWPEGEDGITCERHHEAAADGAWDDHLLFIALTCCEALEKYGIRLERIRTLGPEGGCIASVAEFYARPVMPGPPHPSEIPEPVSLGKRVPAGRFGGPRTFGGR